jgi:transcriptional regulator with XRE-family HTH domain
MTPQEIIGNNIRILRKSKGIKQETLAKQLGLTKGRLSQIENGHCAELSINRIELIANFLKVNFFELLSQQSQGEYSFISSNDFEEINPNAVQNLIKALADELVKRIINTNDKK